MTAPDQERKAMRSAETRLAYAITHNAFAVLSPDECRAIADALAAALTPAPSPEPNEWIALRDFSAPPGPREPTEDAKALLAQFDELLRELAIRNYAVRRAGNTGDSDAIDNADHHNKLYGKMEFAFRAAIKAWAAVDSPASPPPSAIEWGEVERDHPECWTIRATCPCVVRLHFMHEPGLIDSTVCPAHRFADLDSGLSTLHLARGKE